MDMARKVYDYEISKRFSFIPILYIITIVLAVAAYGERFLFWQHAFSDLGMTETQQGHPNHSSMVINAIGMIVIAYQMSCIGLRYMMGSKFTLHKMKCSLAWIGVIGFIVSLTPNNLQHTIHSIGIGCVIGSLFLLTNIFLFENRKEISTLFFVFIIVILYVSVLAYAVEYFANSLNKQVFQKLCVMGLLFSMIMSVRMGENSFRWKDLLPRRSKFPFLHR